MTNTQPIDRTKYMDAGEVARLRASTEGRALIDLKAGRMTWVVTWAVVDTALSTGLRVSELARFTVGDVDLRRGALRTWRLKRKQPVQETIALGKAIKAHLREFLAWKEAAGQSLDPGAPLWVGKRGRLTARGLQLMWKRAVEAAGLPTELSIHSARHTLAVHLLRGTGNLRMVQKQLGHASPATTANMYADVSFEDMQEGLDGLYPPA